MFKKILVAIGGDEAASIEPARAGGRMAAECAATLTIISVKRSLPESLGEPYYSELQSDELDEAEHLLENARAAALAEGAPSVEIEWIEGHAAERIIEFAAYGAYDLLVMGNRRRGRLQSAILGSVSAAVAAHATVPVLIVPEPHS